MTQIRYQLRDRDFATLPFVNIIFDWDDVVCSIFEKKKLKKNELFSDSDRSPERTVRREDF
jgi:hypothetical protein